MHRPDYSGGSIVNLMSSLTLALGAESDQVTYPESPALPAALIGEHPSVVLAVIDGLGYEFLAARPDSFLARHLKARVTSVFPTTTATAITSYLTGLAPQQHALTGWFTYLKELGGVATVLPFRPRGGGALYTDTGVDARDIFDWPVMFDRLRAEPVIVTADYIRDSVYSRVTGGRARRVGYGDLSGFVALSAEHALSQVPVSARGPRYVYSYWPHLDALAHEHGVASKAVAEHFHAVDKAIAQLSERLSGSGTLLIVCADHGHIDTNAGRTIHVEQHPLLDEALALPLCGEPRAAYCYVRPTRTRAFRDYVEGELGEACVLKSSAEIFEEGYFGHGTPHPRLRDRIGDYVLLMRENWIIKDRLANEAPFTQIGVHGGLSSTELYVPLVVVQP